MTIERRKLTRFAAPLAVLALAVLVSAWFIASRPKALPKAPEEQIWPVSSLIVNGADVQPDIEVFGEIRAAREAEIRAMVAGRLDYIDPEFKDGAYLREGAEIARIDAVDYEHRTAEQRAELERAGALLTEYERELEWELKLESNAARQVELAQRALARAEKLSRDGRESHKARDDADAALASTEQNRLQRAQAVARLRSRVTQQRAAHAALQAGLALAERDLARTRVIAPFAGYVTDVRLARGKLLAVGESLGRLLVAGELEARFDLPEAEFARLLLTADKRDALSGREIQVIWRLGEVAQSFNARVVRVGAEIDPTLGGIEVIATVEEKAAQAGLRAGAFVEVRIPDIVYHNVFRIPQRALSDDGYVYVIRDERLVQLEVDVLRQLDDDVLVHAELVDGEHVVARIFAGIGPGLRVREL